MRKLLATAILLTGCAQQIDPAYVKKIQQWRTDRETRLRAEDGWLTLVGLFWLHEGTNKVGSDPNAEVPLPASAPPRVGVIALDKTTAHFRPAAGVNLKETDLRDDNKPDYNILKLNTVSFYLIERGGRYGIRVKDPASPARQNFAGLDWYPPDPTWNVEAKLVPEPHKVTFDTEVGLKEVDDSPGYLDFTRAGQQFRVEPVFEDKDLFIVIRDATSGKTTYAASRFVYADPLGKDGLTHIDFNKAYNPPCVFTPYATCPLPTKQNRLTVPVEAGEKLYRGAAH